MSVDLEEADLPLTEAEEAPLAAEKKGASKKAKAGGSSLSPSKKRKNNKKKNQPGKYSQLVVETIRKLGERNGSSLAKIYNEAKKVAWFDQQNGRTYLKYSIKALVQNDTLLQVKGTGANGSFKLNRKKLEGGGDGAAGGGAHRAPRKAAAAASRRAEKPAGKSQKAEKKSHKKGAGGAAARKDKAKKAAKKGAASPGGKKVKNTSKFLDAVFKQTDIVPHHQEYFFEGHPYELDPNLQAHNFCRTARHNPLTLLSCAEQPEDVVGVRYRDPALDFPKFVPKVDVVADCSAAKSAVGAVHQALRIAQELRQCQELTVRGLHWVIGNLRSECSRVLEQRRGVHVVLSGLQLMEGKTRGLYEAIPGGSALPALKDVAAVRIRLQRVAEELSQCSHSIFDFQGALDGMVSELVQHGQQAHEDKSIRQIECCLEKMQLIYKQFRKARTCPALGYNEEQIHKLDKVNLGDLARKVLLIFQDKCAQRYQEALVLHGSRMRKVCEIKKQLKRLSNRISTCSVEASECQDCLQLALDKFLQTVVPEKHSLAMVPAVPSPVPLSQMRREMALQMQELLEQMKSVSYDLQFNNSIIERLSGAAPAPGV